MEIDLAGGPRARRRLLARTVLAVAASNLLQLGLHLALRTPPPGPGGPSVEEGLVLVRLSPRLFVPRHAHGKQAVSLVSDDQRDVIPRAWLHPVEDGGGRGGEDGPVAHLEVPEGSLGLIMRRKSAWEVYPFSAEITGRGPPGKRRSREIVF